MASKIIISFLFQCLCLAVVLSAQQEPFHPDFSFAPKPKVKSIIEWINNVEKKSKVLKGLSYHFHPLGLLKDCEESGGRYRQHFSYGPNYLLIKVTTLEADSVIAERNLTHKPEFTVEEWQEDQRQFKKFYYYNKLIQPVEEKIFAKRLDQKEDYQLQKRIIFNYNEQDSLIGETIYHYSLQNGQPGLEKSKKLHHYDPDTNRKVKIEIYDTEDQLQTIASFDYNEDGKLKRISSSTAEGILLNERTWQYDKDQLLQKVIENRATESKLVWIYKGGLPIRKKSFRRDTLLVISDFQYTYYE